MIRIALTTTALLAGISTSHAAYTYVDATDGASGNTTLSGGSVLDAGDGTGGTTWRQRDNAGFGSGGTVFEGVQPSPEIKTTLTGLDAGVEYTIYINFWDPSSTFENWNVKAGFVSGSLTTFSREAGAVTGGVASVLASTLTYDTPPSLFGPSSSRDNLAGLVGTFTASAGGEIEVFIDDFDSTDVNQRTWYDGLSYQAVPEPTTTLLTATGVLGLLRRRRH